MKAFIFDLDGVIVDTAKFHFVAWRRLANELGFDFTEHQNEQLKGVSRKESLDLILSWGGVTLSDEDKELWMTRKNDWYLALVNTMTADDILPGTLDFLNQLKANHIKIGLGSASKNAVMILERVGILNYFDSVMDGTKTTKSKPDPEVFLKAAEELGVTPTEAYVVEDAEKGVQAAKRGGFQCLGIGTKEVLVEADIVVTGLDKVAFENGALQVK